MDQTSAAAMWRPATTPDLDDILAIQDVVHGLMPERPEVMAEKLRLCPEGCRVLVGDGGVIGYGLSHPYRLDAVPALDGLLGALPPTTDCWYIHDVALLLPGRGRGAGRAFVDLARTQARRQGIGALALVSVYGTVPVWSALGFVGRDLPDLAAKLGPYGEQARYMVSTGDVAG